MNINENTVVIDKSTLSDIAASIRQVGGGTERYRPSEMADAIRSFNHIPNVKMWTVAFEENQTESTVLVPTDDWLKTYRSDDRLCVAVITNQTLYETTVSYMGDIIATNKSCMRNDAAISQKQLWYRTTANGTVLSRNWHDWRLDAGPDYAGALYIDIDGNLKRTASTSLAMLAGTYTVIAWLV